MTFTWETNLNAKVTEIKGTNIRWCFIFAR